eukprot:TRINITY_DN32089_c0_g1_i1.p3 TRINITY_DN32089_c0_g1~~TRINITY_DN32089_c0_g1_i1.p3  ORF type:complete len:138 (-),score=29.27 TRINITY_DN32089_c0_g1_i1:56-469(-)
MQISRKYRLSFGFRHLTKSWLDASRKHAFGGLQSVLSHSHKVRHNLVRDNWNVWLGWHREAVANKMDMHHVLFYHFNSQVSRCFSFWLQQAQSKKHIAHALLSLIHISEPTRLLSISYAVFCLKKKKKTHRIKQTHT